MGKVTIFLCALSIILCSLFFACVDGQIDPRTAWQRRLDMQPAQSGGGVSYCRYWCGGGFPETCFEPDGTRCEADFGYGVCFIGRCVPRIFRRSGLSAPHGPHERYHGGGCRAWRPRKVGYKGRLGGPEDLTGYEQPWPDTGGDSRPQRLPFNVPREGFKRRGSPGVFPGIIPQLFQSWLLVRVRVLSDVPSAPDDQRPLEKDDRRPHSQKTRKPKVNVAPFRVPSSPSKKVRNTSPGHRRPRSQKNRKPKVNMAPFRVPSSPTKKVRSTSPDHRRPRSQKTRKPKVNMAPFRVPSSPTKKGRRTSPDHRRPRSQKTRKPKVNMAPFRVPSSPTKKVRSTSPDHRRPRSQKTRKPKVNMAPFRVPSSPTKKGHSTSSDVRKPPSRNTEKIPGSHQKPELNSAPFSEPSSPIKKGHPIKEGKVPADSTHSTNAGRNSAKKKSPATAATGSSSSKPQNVTVPSSGAKSTPTKPASESSVTSTIDYD